MPRKKATPAGPVNPIPEKYRARWKAMKRSRSRKERIWAFCFQCVGFLQVEVRNCTCKICPLYEVRPYQCEEEEETGNEV